MFSRSPGKTSSICGRVKPRLICLFSAILVAQAAALPHLEWDASTLRLLLPGGGYGRIHPLANGSLLASAERQRTCVVLRSNDDGRTWTAPVTVATFAHGIAANPELCPLRDGRVLLLWNERPVPDNGPHPYTIRMSSSSDGGITWIPCAEPIYPAGTTMAAACWEPAAIQMPDGNIRLFFAHELPGQQEIATMVSQDGGLTWSEPRQASLRPNRRDGMPVPCLLQDGTLALSVEDNGVLPATKGRHPPFRPSIVLPDRQQRWTALCEPPAETVNVAAPYLVRLPTGETLLSVQSNEDEHRRHRMAVYVGNENAQDFRNRSLPFGLPPQTNGEWNSLCVLDADTVIALSTTTIEGQRGLWSIRGHVRRTATPMSARP